MWGGGGDNERKTSRRTGEMEGQVRQALEGESQVNVRLSMSQGGQGSRRRQMVVEEEPSPKSER